jgi:hypothetical protein
MAQNTGQVLTQFSAFTPRYPLLFCEFVRTLRTKNARLAAGIFL